MTNEDSTRPFSAEGEGKQQGRGLDDLFSLVESLRSEFTEFRERVEVRLLRTTPLSETLEVLRGEIGLNADRLDKVVVGLAESAKSLTELARGSRRIESKVNGISIDFSEIKGTLQDHEVRLQALNSE